MRWVWGTGVTLRKLSSPLPLPFISFPFRVSKGLQHPLPLLLATQQKRRVQMTHRCAGGRQEETHLQSHSSGALVGVKTPVDSLDSPLEGVWVGGADHGNLENRNACESTLSAHT